MLRHLIDKLFYAQFFPDAPGTGVRPPQKVLHFPKELAPNLFEYLGCKFSFDSETGKYSCSLCGALYKQKAHLYQHIRNVHLNPQVLSTAEATAACPTQKVIHTSVEIAPNLFEYQGHKFAFEPSTAKYSCCLCGGVCRRKHNMQCHIRGVHLNPDGYKEKWRKKKGKCRLNSWRQSCVLKSQAELVKYA